MKLDLDRIQQRTQFISSNLELLYQLRDQSEQEFSQDRIKLFAAAHLLQTAIDAMLDIFAHMIARLGLGAPTNDRETLEVIRKKGLICQDHFRRYIEMNKFRNLVVHGYLHTDPQRVHKILHSDLGDFELFMDDVKHIVQITHEQNVNPQQRRKPRQSGSK